MTKRLVMLGDNVTSYSDKFNLVLSRNINNDKPDIQEIPNETFFYQKMLFQKILKEVKRENIPLHRCDICLSEFKDVEHWYVHMRRMHKNG